MLIWRLWRELGNPPLHSPLRKRLLRRRSFMLPPLPDRILRRVQDAALAVLPIFLIFVGFPIMIVMYALLLVFAPLLIPLLNSAYGLAHVLEISGAIAREHERGHYDMIAVTPGGAFTLHWTYASLWTRFYPELRGALLALVYTGVFGSLLSLSWQVFYLPRPVEPLIYLVRAGAFAAFFGLDYISTRALAGVTAIAVPVLARTSLEARAAGGVGFAFLQIVTYTLTFAFGWALLPRLLSPAAFELVAPPLTVLLFAALREAQLRVMWQFIITRLGVGAPEFDRLLGRQRIPIPVLPVLVETAAQR